MSTTTNVLLAIRAAHRPSEPRDEELDQLRDDQVPRSRPPRYPWPIRRIRDGELHDAPTAQPGEKLDRRHCTSCPVRTECLAHALNTAPSTVFGAA
ncbi:WhiB family transcriptional regulator [Streptomyces violaceus]|uniref:WhiB family transcriptional regulator n=1 Tax=Streptomyces violaceus TaxID=1936 RepID=UPI00399D708B